MRPSRTAQFVALYRALETDEMRREPMFRDPLAMSFVPAYLALMVRLARTPGLRGLLERYADHRAPGGRTSAICRTRFIDDAVRREVEAGTRQLVLLGAGFDCRAHRLPELRDTRVFEVDRRQTQTHKRSVIERQTGTRPVSYVEVDFQRDDLRTRLVQAGWNAAERTTFVWEGVTPYLNQSAVEGVLALVGSTPSGSALVFTYVHRGVLDGSAHFAGANKVMSVVRRMGEPWSFGIMPEELADFVARFGLELLEDLGADEYRTRYPWTHGVSGYAFYRIAIVRVR